MHNGISNVGGSPAILRMEAYIREKEVENYQIHSY